MLESISTDKNKKLIIPLGLNRVTCPEDPEKPFYVIPAWPESFLFNEYATIRFPTSGNDDFFTNASMLGEDI